jgi:hypothetical protein
VRETHLRSSELTCNNKESDIFCRGLPEALKQLELETGSSSGVGNWEKNREEMTRKELGCTKKIS